jgi:glutathione S-transferase
MWVRADVIGLVSINVGAFSQNVGRRGWIFSANLGPQLRMLSGPTIYVRGPLHLQINPFGRIPSFEHDGFRIYEAVAIARYIDEAFSGPELQPRDIRERARMNQILGVLDGYVYRTLVWDIYVERSGGASSGTSPDEQRIAAALPRARTCLNALSGLMADGTWLAGSALTLADIHATPMFAYFLRTAEGKDLLASVPSLMRWWEQVAQRASVRATEAGQ